VIQYTTSPPRNEKKIEEKTRFMCRTLKSGYSICVRENTAVGLDTAIVKDTGEIVMDTLENKKMRGAFGGRIGASSLSADSAVSRGAAGAASLGNSVGGEAKICYNMAVAGGAAI
jgi:hypothetical protein